MEKVLPTTSSRHTGQQRLDDRHRRLIDFIVRRHWKPLYYYLLHRGYDNDEARDLTQEFFLEIVLKRDLVAQVDPTKGQLRPFLILALSRYVIDVKRRMSSRRHILQDKAISLDAIEPSRLCEINAESIPRYPHEYIWLSELLEHTLQQVETECQQKGKSEHWYVFQEHVLRPIVDRTDCPQLKEVGRKCGIDETTASNMIVTVKRRLRKLLAQRLRKLIISDEQARNEIEYIQGFVPEIARENAG